MKTTRKCTKCKQEKEWSNFNIQSNGLNGRASVCKECRRKYAREYYADNKKTIRTDEFKKRSAKTARNNRLMMRVAAIQAYGGKCVCCGEATLEFLVIDHINGGGEKHRASLGCPTGGYPFYAKLKKLGYPFKDELRVLCANCNSSYGAYGYCPHTK